MVFRLWAGNASESASYLVETALDVLLFQNGF